MLLTDSPATYVDGDEWTTTFGAVALVGTRQWGWLTQRRFALASGLEVEFGIVSPRWASTDPLDAGTRRVVSDALVALYDPDGLLTALVDAVASRR